MIIETKDEYQAAIEQFEALFDAQEGSPEAYQRDALSILIEKYEDENIPLDLFNRKDKEDLRCTLK